MKPDLSEGVPIVITLYPYFWYGAPGVVERVNCAAPSRTLGIRLDDDKDDRIGLLWLSPNEVQRRDATEATVYLQGMSEL